MEYLKEVLAHRQVNPGEDLISTMLDVEDSGDTLTDAEIVGTSILALNAGHEATVHAIGNSLLALARDPGAYHQLASGEADVSTAIDELLRLDSPLQMFERWVPEDTEIGGQLLAKGSKVGLLFGSANHDESVFEASEGLDLMRAPNPHVSFGAGVHHCVGAPLAKVELEVALGLFTKRVRAIELKETANRIESLVFRGVRHLELELTPV